MCSRATAALVFCPRALMDAVWSRFLKLNSLLLLSSLSVIQRLVNGVQQNLQFHSRQQQVKRQNGLSLGWRLLFLLMIFIKCVMVSKHVSAASSGIAKDYNSNSQLIWMSSVFFFVVVVLWGFLCECNAQVPVTHKWRGTNKNRSYAHLKCLIFLWSDPYMPTYLVFVFLRPGLIVFAECNWALYQWCDVIIPFLGCGARYRVAHWQLMAYGGSCCPLLKGSHALEQCWKVSPQLHALLIISGNWRLCLFHIVLTCIAESWLIIPCSSQPVAPLLLYTYDSMCWDLGWDAEWLMGLLLKIMLALKFNLSAPRIRNPTPRFFLSNNCSNCKLLHPSIVFCLLFFLFSHSATIINGSTKLLLIPKTPSPECCNTLHEE